VPKEHGEVLARRLQRAIERIDGVDAAKVILDHRDDVAEVHLVGTSARRPKQIVRDIESLFYAEFGIHVDYRRISFVRVGPERAPSSGRRLRFVSAMALAPEDRVRVTLQNNEERYEGTATLSVAPEEDEPVACAIANATLSALQQAVPPGVRLTVRNVMTVATGGQTIALVIILAYTARGEERLTGSCIVGSDICEAAAKATLDAVNRRLTVWAALQEPAR
jgi:hypothetical protein